MRKYILLTGLMLLASTSFAGRKVFVIDVTSIVYDNDSNDNPLITRSDDYNGTGQATYYADADRSRIFTDVGMWQVLPGAGRSIWLNMNFDGMPFPKGYYQASEVYSRCFDAVSGEETGFLAIKPGTSNNNCLFGVDFAANGIGYKLVMGPLFQGQDGAPPTGLTTVTCTQGDTSGSCDAWTITPYMESSSTAQPTVANIYQTFSKRGKIVWVYIGSINNTYRIDVTNP